VRPDDLAAHVLRELLARSPDLDPARIDDVLYGAANGAGEDNRNVARMAVLLAGLPTSVPANTVNRLCGSSLDAAMQASRAIETGDADQAREATGWELAVADDLQVSEEPTAEGLDALRELQRSGQPA